MIVAGGYLDTLRRRVPHIMVLAATLAAMDMMRAFPLLAENQDLASALREMLGLLVQSLASTAVLVAAITYAERTALAQRRRGLALGICVLVAAPLATAIGAWLSIATASIGWLTLTLQDSFALYLYLLWYSLVVGLLAAAYFTMWERAHESKTRLRAAEIERQGIEQRVVESRLNVLKARVDPEFLFRMIGDVQRLYRSDVDAAEERLEDLIAYLRAALPQMRGGATTLGEEVRLAEAYVRLHEEGFEGRLQAAFDVDEPFDEAQFPPMALLPLVDDALRRASAASRPSLFLRVAASHGGGGLVVTVDDNCRNRRLEAQGNPALVGHERAFTQFFGEGARIRRETAGPGTRVLLEIDYATPARAPR
jgi:sensor histidine kinase YesM